MTVPLNLPVTVFTGASPIGKRFTRRSDGSVHKTSLGGVKSGSTAEVRTVASLREFAALRANLTTRQALSYGNCGHPKARVLRLDEIGRHPPGPFPDVARGRDWFDWPSGPGILMLDHDPTPGCPAIEGPALLERVLDALPGLAGCQALWAPSAGSYIHDSSSGMPVVGLRGSRLYFAVDDAQCIPELGALLFDRLALNGHGSISISGSGRMLRRGLVDTAVWQPERIDYARADCGHGLEQRAGRPLMWFESGGPVDAASVLRDSALTAEETASLASIWAGLESVAAPRAEEIRQAWAVDRAREQLGDGATEEQLRMRAEELAALAQREEIHADHVLRLAGGAEVTVRELLEDPASYATDRHGNVRMADPMEPSYRDDDRIALLVLSENGAAHIVSHAHGRQVYVLRGPTTPEDEFGDLEDKASADSAATAPPSKEGSAANSSTITPPSPAPRAITTKDMATPLTPAKPRHQASVVTVAEALRRPEFCGKVVGFDAFTSRVMLAEPPTGGAAPQWRDLTDADFTRLREHLQRRGFSAIAKDLMRDTVAMVAEDQAFDSAQAWLKALNWDGTPRVASFLPRYFGAEDRPYTRAVSRYFWTALAGRVLEPGLKSDMVAVAVGAQGARKSSTIAACVPDDRFFGELDLARRDDDTARKLQGKLVIELPELRGLKSRDAESLKAFLSARHDEWVEKWQVVPRKAPRRCVFMGSSNRRDFLADTTGNRRWLPFDAGACDPEALRGDCEQLWAEAATMFRRSGLDHREAEDLARQEHEAFTEVDAMDEVVARWLETAGVAGDCQPAPLQFVTTTQVVNEAMGLRDRGLQRGDQMRAADILRRLGWRDSKGRIGGKQVRGWARG